MSDDKIPSTKVFQIPRTGKNLELDLAIEIPECLNRQINYYKVWKFLGLQLLKMMLFWKEPDWINTDILLICYISRKRHLCFFFFLKNP